MRVKKVPKEKAFYFFTSIGNYTGENASSPENFLEKVKEIASKSLEFHFYRGDFEKWIREVWGYEELAQRMNEIERLNLKREPLRNYIHNAISDFLELQKRERQNRPRLRVRP